MEEPVMSVVAPSQPSQKTLKSERFEQLMAEKAKFDEEIIAAEETFEETLEAIGPSPLFVKFLTEYKKMNAALGKSKDHVQKLIAQFEEYESEYMENISQNEETYKAQGQDSTLIQSLKTQIKEGEQVLAQFAKNDEVIRNEVRQTKVDVLNLSNTIKQGVGLSSTQEKSLLELTNAKETLVKDIAGEMDKIVNIRARISEISDKNRMADSSKRDLESEIFSLKEKNAAKKAEIDAEVRNKDRLENELRELRVLITVKSQEVKNKQDSVNRATDDIAIFESHIKNQKLLAEKLNKDQDSLESRTAKLKEDYEIQYKEHVKMTDENELLFKQLKEKESDLAMHRLETKKIGKLKETLIRKNRELEEKKVLAELERKTLRQNGVDLTKKVEEHKKSVEMGKKNIEELRRERDIINQNQVKVLGNSAYQTSLISILKRTRHNMNLDIVRYMNEIDEYSQKIDQYKKEKESIISEAVKSQEMCLESLAAIKEKELLLHDYKKQIGEYETKIKHQQNLYESVLTDKKLRAKQLLDAEAEIAGMRRKLKIMNFRINGSKEEIYAKEVALNKEVTDLTKISKDIDSINEEIKNLKSQQELAQTYIKTQVAERSKLARFAKEAESEKLREEKALNALISERDNLSGQLMRQNEELAKVYDKIKTLQTLLNRGEIHYNEKCKIAQNIRLEIQQLRKQHRSLASETESLPELKQHLINVEEELIKEKTKLKALEEQLRYPMNIHRWRKMEGSNPKEFELLQMIWGLQKKLISLSKDDQEKQNLISKKEELYLHLKGLLAKQVGPEAQEQIQEYETILKDKNLQLKHMSAELNMYQAQVREYRYSISQVDKTLEDLKKQVMQKYKTRLSLGKNAVKNPVRIKSALKKPNSSQNSQPNIQDSIPSEPPTDYQDPETVSHITREDTQESESASLL